MAKTNKKMAEIGELDIVIGDTEVWTNSVEVANRIRDEDRRTTWRKQKGSKEAIRGSGAR